MKLKEIMAVNLVLETRITAHNADGKEDYFVRDFRKDEDPARLCRAIEKTVKYANYNVISVWTYEGALILHVSERE